MSEEEELEVVATETRGPISTCCGKRMNAAGGLDKALDVLRHPAGKRDRRDVYVYAVCGTCGFVQRLLLGHRPKKKRTGRGRD